MSLLFMTVVTTAILGMSVLCTTVYLHRSETHGGLELHPVIRNLMHLWTTVFTGIVPKEWVAVHRKHHHFSDQEGDPHSPKIFGLWHVLFGNYWYYRKDAKNAAVVAKYAPDYVPDLVDRLPLTNYGVWAGLVVFVLMFGFRWGAAGWLFHIVTYVLLNSAVNSLGHSVGGKHYNNGATNVPLLPWLTFGEGYHNNHHFAPTSALFAHAPGEFDPAWPVIRLLKILHLAEVKFLPQGKAT